MISPTNTPIASEEYTSFVISARPKAKMGGTIDHTPVEMRSKPSIRIPLIDAVPKREPPISVPFSDAPGTRAARARPCHPKRRTVARRDSHSSMGISIAGTALPKKGKRALIWRTTAKASEPSLVKHAEPPLDAGAERRLPQSVRYARSDASATTACIRPRALLLTALRVRARIRDRSRPRDAEDRRRRELWA